MILPSIITAEVSEKEIFLKINELRGLKLPKSQDEIEKINDKLNSLEKFLHNNKEKAIPILKRELEAEIIKDNPDNFFLLFVGHFLFREDEKANKELALKTLKKLDPDDEIIKADFRILFDLTLGIAAVHDNRILEVIDSIFLPTAEKVFIPEHYLTLNASLMCVFLYGVYGPDSEEHLLGMLQKEPAHTRRILEILNWIGTERSVDHIKKIMITHSDYETYSRTIGFFMKLGGPKGKSIVLNTDIDNLDVKAREYYEKIKQDVEQQSYKEMLKIFETMGGEKTLPDDILKQRLKTMYENYGKDDKTNPLAILNSKLPVDYLIDELVKIRSRMLFRVSDEALYDVEMTNTVINALLYKRDKV